MSTTDKIQFILIGIASIAVVCIGLALAVHGKDGDHDGRN